MLTMDMNANRAPVSYIMRIKLQERDKLFYIYDQEEFMHSTVRPLLIICF